MKRSSPVVFKKKKAPPLEHRTPARKEGLIHFNIETADDRFSTHT